MEDIVLNKMKQLGVPETRENYLSFAYFGTPPEHLTAEQEMELPKQFRQTATEPESEPEAQESKPTWTLDDVLNSSYNDNKLEKAMRGNADMQETGNAGAGAGENQPSE